MLYWEIVTFFGVYFIRLCFELNTLTGQKLVMSELKLGWPVTLTSDPPAINLRRCIGRKRTNCNLYRKLIATINFSTKHLCSKLSSSVYFGQVVAFPIKIAVYKSMYKCFPVSDMQCWQRNIKYI